MNQQCGCRKAIAGIIEGASLRRGGRNNLGNELAQSVQHRSLYRSSVSGRPRCRRCGTTNIWVETSGGAIGAGARGITFWQYQGISYTTILSAMPRKAACFWIGVIAAWSRMAVTAGTSITDPVTWIACEVDSPCTRAAMLTVWPK